MANFVSNVRLSGPIPVAAKPDVDLNGMMFSYTIGLMFPTQAASSEPQFILPTTPPAPPVNRSGGPSSNPPRGSV
jgi:hypothetical protein